MKVLCVFGTRAELIKLAPVVHALQRRARFGECKSIVCVSGPQRQLSDQLLHSFGITPNYDLRVMGANQTPTHLMATVLERLEPVLRVERPDWVLVQGETVTAAAAGLAGFYSRARVGHIEAGLRSQDRRTPFPGEINRRLIDAVADMYFAATEQAARNLAREGTPVERILVTGNTVVDALRWAAAQPFPTPEPLLNLAARERVVLVTLRTQEQRPEAIQQICAALGTLAARYSESLRIVFPLPASPEARKQISAALGNTRNIRLSEPLGYLSLVHTLKRAYLALTDSGGLQEEAPSLGKPVLVLCPCTDRTEGLEAGVARIVGVDASTIVQETARLLDDPWLYAAMTGATDLYGDGTAGERIVDALLATQPQSVPVEQALARGA
jgi:UDP-N-acetylglucosamine 2-epimerase (non-hydrolysing)